jgi:hypothetical protein
MLLDMITLKRVTLAHVWARGVEGVGGRENKSYTLRRVLLQYRVKRAVLQVWPIQASMLLKVINLYLPSVVMKVPDHVYVLGDTYTCHMLI